MQFYNSSSRSHRLFTGVGFTNIVCLASGGRSIHTCTAWCLWNFFLYVFYQLKLFLRLIWFYFMSVRMSLKVFTLFSLSSCSTFHLRSNKYLQVCSRQKLTGFRLGNLPRFSREHSEISNNSFPLNFHKLNQLLCRAGVLERTWCWMCIQHSLKFCKKFFDVFDVFNVSSNIFFSSNAAQNIKEC